MIPHKTYIPNIPEFVYLVCFLQPEFTAVGLFSWHYFLASSLLCIILFSVSILIWSLTQCFPVHFKYFCKFSIKNITIWHFLQQLFNTCYLFWRNGANVCDTRYYISIATDDDIIQFGDDVNIYPLYSSRAIIICGNCLNLLEKTIVSDHILSISFKQIWELTYGHWVYVGTCIFIIKTEFATVGYVST